MPIYQVPPLRTGGGKNKRVSHASTGKPNTEYVVVFCANTNSVGETDRRVSRQWKGQTTNFLSSGRSNKELANLSCRLLANLSVSSNSPKDNITARKGLNAELDVDLQRESEVDR